MKINTPCLLIGFLIYAGAINAQQIPSEENQIKSAVLACPADQRDNASVYGYDQNGKWKELRKGTNAMVSVGDDPSQKGFSAACYHRDLEAFMERGRALKTEGKTFNEIFEMREQEVKEGKLKMPKDPSSLFVFTAADEDFDAANGEVKNGYLRYVIYIPYATAESTGLPLKPEAPGMPWIMDPGTHRAHIMINPPKN